MNYYKDEIHLTECHVLNIIISIPSKTFQKEVKGSQTARQAGCEFGHSMHTFRHTLEYNFKFFIYIERAPTTNRNRQNATD